jgi:co-chaperonin GroES (HSP10)
MADDFNTGGPKLYTVLAVGPGRRTKRGLVVPLPIQPGDRVLCHSYTEGPVDLADDTKIITGEQVLAIFPQ